MPDYDDSLGDQNTFDGSSKPADRGPQSIGDEATLGGIRSDLELGSIEINLEITDLASRYTIEGDLGKGGMGQVQLAVDTRLDRKVAIKRIHGKALTNTKAWQRFETGAKTLAN